MPGKDDSDEVMADSDDGQGVLPRSETDARDEVDRIEPVRCTRGSDGEKDASTPSGWQLASSDSGPIVFDPETTRLSMPEITRESLVEIELRRLPPMGSAPQESHADEAAVPTEPAEAPDASVGWFSLIRCLTVPPPSVEPGAVLFVLPGLRSDEALEEKSEKAVHESKLRRRSDLGGEALMSGESLPETASAALMDGDPTTRT